MYLLLNNINKFNNIIASKTSKRLNIPPEEKLVSAYLEFDN